MAANVSVPTTSVSQVTGVEILTCFEIMHTKDMEICGIDENWIKPPLGGYSKTIIFINSVGRLLSQKYQRGQQG